MAVCTQANLFNGDYICITSFEQQQNSTMDIFTQSYGWSGVPTQVKLNIGWSVVSTQA